jgi:hypothetical protein
MRPRLAHFPLVLGLGASVLLPRSGVAAEPPRTEPPKEASPAALPEELPRLILEDGRIPWRPPNADGFWLDLHGEVQLRAERDSDLPLRAPISDPTLTTLGQRTLGTGWMRFGVRLGWKETLRAVLSADFVPNAVMGDLAQGVSSAGLYARDTSVPAAARLREAFVDWNTPIGLLRVGQSTSHWGMGLLANDGDHAMPFGDYRYGSLVERVLFATRPLGKSSPLTLAIAGDLVFLDTTTSLADGDSTKQLVAAATWEKGAQQVGVYGVRRWQDVSSQGDSGYLDVWIADLAARGAIALPRPGVYGYGALEVAGIFGHTNVIRTTPEVLESDIQSYGGAAQLGVISERTAADGRRYGSLGVSVEWGYASGDGNPYDATIKRFSFDPNHQVGLVLFPFVMHYSYARAATNALDPSLAARAPSGVRFLNTYGGVAGAQYVNPVVTVRPTPDIDVRAGVLVAVATADFIDPYGLTVTGKEANFNGGSGKSRDLGVELDWGFDWRIPVDKGQVTIGLQQGLLLPGHAFDDAQGHGMRAQGVTQARFGFQF